MLSTLTKDSKVMYICSSVFPIFPLLSASLAPPFILRDKRKSSYLFPVVLEVSVKLYELPVLSENWVNPVVPPSCCPISHNS